MTTKVLDLSISFGGEPQVDKQLDKYQSCGYPDNGQNPVRNTRKQVSNDFAYHIYSLQTMLVMSNQGKMYPYVSEY